mmetsp:Transcript_29878/g.72417  ORF Transcript_29878/g.72417 Transcript_29878/m.72417 type:complete len:242 (-) Transcript_29878:398-1123(-)
MIGILYSPSSSLLKDRRSQVKSGPVRGSFSQTRISIEQKITCDGALPSSLAVYDFVRSSAFRSSTLSRYPRTRILASRKFSTAQRHRTALVNRASRTAGGHLCPVFVSASVGAGKVLSHSRMRFGCSASAMCVTASHSSSITSSISSSSSPTSIGPAPSSPSSAAICFANFHDCSARSCWSFKLPNRIRPKSEDHWRHRRSQSRSKRLRRTVSGPVLPSIALLWASCNVFSLSTSSGVSFV